MSFYTDKQAYEEFYLEIDFTACLQGANLNSAVVTVILNGVDVTTSIVDVTKQQILGRSVLFWVKGGVVNFYYDIIIKIVGSDDSKYEENLRLYITN